MSPTDQPAAYYRQVADRIRQRIHDGVWAPGTQLPSEPELAGEFSTNRGTINQAIRILRTEGLVRVVRRGPVSGMFVRPITELHRTASTRYRRQEREQAGGGVFATEVRAQGMTPRSEVTVARVTPPDLVADTLGLPRGQENTVVRRRRMFADDEPVQFAPTYIPLKIAAGTILEDEAIGPGGMMSRLADLGLAEARITESVRVRRSTDEEREFLRLEMDAPVTEIWRVARTADGRPVEVTVCVLPAYLWVLDYEVDAGE